MNHKLDAYGIFVKGLKIDSFVMTPMCRNNYDEEFVIDSGGVRFSRNAALSSRHIVEWQFKTNDEEFQKK